MILYDNNNPMENASGYNNYGVLHFTGILLNCSDEIEYLLSIFTENEQDCIDAIQNLEGQFALVWKTDLFCIATTDFSLTRFLYRKDNNISTRSQDNYDLLLSNTIYVYKSNLDLKNTIPFFKNYSSEPTYDSFNLLINSLNETLAKLNKKQNPLTLFLSEGIDSGFLHCMMLHNNITFNVINYQRYPIQPITLAIIKKRMSIHKSFTSSEFKVIYDTVHDEGLGPEYFNTSNATPDDNIVLVGCNADRIFTDYEFRGKKLDKENNQSRWKGIFPENLHEHENYWINKNSVDLMSKLMPTFANKEEKVFDVFATKQTIIEWYKIKSLIKNNQTYKQWMIEYSRSVSSVYPNITNSKNGIQISN